MSEAPRWLWQTARPPPLPQQLLAEGGNCLPNPDSMNTVLPISHRAWDFGRKEENFDHQISRNSGIWSTGSDDAGLIQSTKAPNCERPEGGTESRSADMGGCFPRTPIGAPRGCKPTRCGDKTLEAARLRGHDTGTGAISGNETLESV